MVDSAVSGSDILIDFLSTCYNNYWKRIAEMPRYYGYFKSKLWIYLFSLFSSIIFCFMYSQVQLLGPWTFRIVFYSSWIDFFHYFVMLFLALVIFLVLKSMSHCLRYLCFITLAFISWLMELKLSFGCYEVKQWKNWAGWLWWIIQIRKPGLCEFRQGNRGSNARLRWGNWGPRGCMTPSWSVTEPG